MRTVLLAGSTGVLGRHVARELTARGYRVRRLVREDAGTEEWLGDLRFPASLQGAVEGVDAIISCAGASMRLGNFGDRFTFNEIDWLGNRNLLDVARRTGVTKFVYVSLAGGVQLRHTAYAKAHERFVDALVASRLRHTVVRPTGFHSFFGEILEMARKGRGVVIGDGSAQTNPIHEGEVARACVDALSAPAAELPVGGPIVYTRHAIATLAFWALGQVPTIRSVPPWALRPVPSLLRVLNPRIAALVEFGIAVSQTDVIAPRYGSKTLEDYFRDLAARKCDRCPSPQTGSGSFVNSRPTMNASGFSRERNGTRSFSAHR